MSSDIGARLKAIRLDRGLSRDELYAASTVSTVSITRIEQNRQNPSGTMLSDLADALECTTDEILGRVPFKPRNLPKKEIEQIIERDRSRYTRKVSSTTRRRRGSKSAYLVQASLRDELMTPFGSPDMYPNMYESAALPGQMLALPDRFATISAASATSDLTSGNEREFDEITTPPTRDHAA